MGEERIELSLLANTILSRARLPVPPFALNLIKYYLNSIRTKIILKPKKMFTQLYNKCLKLAAHKSSIFFRHCIFLESSFFPIPPDVMIAPMVIAKKNNFIKIF